MQVALGRVPGLVYKTFAPGGGAMGTMANEIAIRGVSNGTLIMLNGSPMNLRGKYFLDAIPIDSIEKVEIVKGGGSVLYGSEAMGGVINIITKQDFKNSVTAGVGNYGQQKYNATVNADKLSVGYNLEKWGNVDTISRSHDKGDKHTDMNSSHKNNLFLNYKINDNWNFLYNYFETLYLFEFASVSKNIQKIYRRKMYVRFVGKKRKTCNTGSDLRGRYCYSGRQVRGLSCKRHRG